MTIKDWILLVVPILANGILVFIFQKVITANLEHFHDRETIRSEVIKAFWRKLQNLNDTFIQANINISRNPATLSQELENIRTSVLEIIGYYDSNQYDLKIYDKKYRQWEQDWNQCNSTIMSFRGMSLTHDQQSRLANELQTVKTRTQELIDAVRKKY